MLKRRVPHPSPVRGLISVLLVSALLRLVIVLQGGMGRRELAATFERLTQIPANAPRVILATGGYIGEGFDDPRLDTLFLTMPVSWRGTIAQYVGRLHRLHDKPTV